MSNCNRGWENYTLSNKFVALKEAKPGDHWDGYFMGLKDGNMGQLLVLKSESETLVFPYSGVLKALLEGQMEAKKFDYLRIIYKGQETIQKGRWAGKKCYTFDVARNVLFSGEDKYRKIFQNLEDSDLDSVLEKTVTENDIVEERAEYVPTPESFIENFTESVFE